MLLRGTTAAEITASMQRVNVADLDTWKRQHLPTTLTSRRQLLYGEVKLKPKRTKQERATPIGNNNQNL